MDAHASHNSSSQSVQCPLCSPLQRGHKVNRGLVVCPYCQERLVVTWSGHYVRDPFIYKQVESEQIIRRKSRPIARFLRDFGWKQSSPILLIVGSTAALGLALTYFGGMQAIQSTVQQWLPSQNQTISSPPEP
jgi:hypothetical protein